MEDLTDYSLAVETPDPNRLIFFDSSTKNALAPQPPSLPIPFEEVQPRCPAANIHNRCFPSKMHSARIDEEAEPPQERMSNPVKRANSRAEKSQKKMSTR
jgi:hypothetical protein